MRPSTVVILRAYLMAASLGAAFIGVSAAAASVLFDIDDRVFESTVFRLSAASVVIGLVFVVKWMARRAFQSALVGHHALDNRTGPGRVEISSECPRRSLVVLHLLFHCDAFDMAE
ncbi:MAG: hypothetical protein ACRYGG_03235 [Janthinobacterium lividum]